MKRPTSHREIFHNFLKATEQCVMEIKAKNKELKDEGDFDEITQMHNTGVIIRRWFNSHGDLHL